MKIESFESICSRLSIWILEYRSDTYKNPIFLIWYTDSDENSKDKLLTFDTGEIFASDSLFKIKEVVINNLNTVQINDNFNQWLDSFEDLTPVENCTYNINALFKNIKNGRLKIETIEGLANFINLYDDYINQDAHNEHLLIYRENKFLDAAWDYFYTFIFWPRFNDSEKFKIWKRPKLKINKEKLFEGFQEMRQQFEQKIKLVCN